MHVKSHTQNYSCWLFFRGTKKIPFKNSLLIVEWTKQYGATIVRWFFLSWFDSIESYFFLLISQSWSMFALCSSLFLCVVFLPSTEAKNCGSIKWINIVAASIQLKTKQNEVQAKATKIITKTIGIKLSVASTLENRKSSCLNWFVLKINPSDEKTEIRVFTFAFYVHQQQQ